ncbi:primosomal protein N' [Parvibaculum sp.]|uniref:primosomal protein N' n=1 Tax=Parvibaculum sp. TaxID=2024848 RepID=UPI00272FCD6B|nr:primosomal protein N' [Parvibaculum sp.]MDP1627352.1 primosomal protein N' [Parvibaculum sp.]MDP2149431.1 primosomal protein N' [Parvibaculum sp.]MDP3327964.1 primosomal protein N' [Parvibaculum sp.]
MASEISTGPTSASGTVSVLIPLALPKPYDYKVPAGMTVRPGDYVVVPLGPQELLGVVWGEGTGEVGHNRLKAIVEVLDAPPMPEVSRRFVDWVAGYTLSPAGSVLRLTIRAPGALEPQRMRTAYRLCDTRPGRMTPARLRVVETASDGFARTVRELAEEAGVSDGVVRGLVDAGTLQPVDIPTEAPFPAPNPDADGVDLSPQQAEAAALLAGHVEAERFAAVLLDGITGSGKTEVYFEAVAAALRRKKQVLILLPEIALTSQFLDRFERRFGCRPAEWHSDVPSRERRRVWRAVAEGSVSVVVGARSALFLPFPDLGLIVVDEEHDAAFKQEDGVAYHARDMAVVRASLGHFPVVLSSATPSLETVVNVEQGRYAAVRLDARYGEAELPHVTAIDMRAHPPERGRWLSPVLVTEIARAMEAGEQAMLFLNRRGYAPLTLCRTCGHRIECPQCSAWLVEHRFRRELVCHHCGYSAPVPKACPSCGAEDTLIACGPGVERIAEEVTELFPEARVAVVSSDNLRGPAAHEAVFAAIEAREVDIVIGTQIVAKGHHFPWLTVVGVVDADLGLENGDLRAGERTFQLLQQVAGRAGRAERPGRVFLQSWMPEHSVMRALVSGRRDEFLVREAAARERVSLPPYGRLVGVVVSSPDAELARKVAREMSRRAPRADNVAVLGPAPAPMALLRGRTRLRFLVKAGRNVNVQAYMQAWLADMKIPNAVRVSVDIDPYSFL